MPKRTEPLRQQPCKDCKVPFDVYHRFQERCPACQMLYRNTRQKTYKRTCEKCRQEFFARNCRTKVCPVCSKESVCKTCGEAFEKTSCQPMYFCSEMCRNKFKNELYFGGNYMAVLDRDGFACVKCGSKVGPHVHHIDLTGRFKKTDKDRCNNSMDNLITLCNSCHQTLHNTIDYELTQRYTDAVKCITAQFIGG